MSLFVNLIVDPLNVLEWNTTVPLTNVSERELKSVALFKHPHAFTGVVVGSSRSSYVNVTRIPEGRFFNYSVSGIGIQEYLPMLLFFQKTQSKPQRIILAFDLYGALDPLPREIPVRGAIAFASSWWSVLVLYCKLREAVKSLRTLLRVQKIQECYGRDLVKQRRDQRQGLNKTIVKKYVQEARFYRSATYSAAYKTHLRALKKSFPDTLFTIVILPVYGELFQAMVATPASRRVYEEWVKDIEDVFGKVYNFSERKDVTGSPRNFFDCSHLYPEVADQILQEVLQQEFKKFF